MKAAIFGALWLTAPWCLSSCGDAQDDANSNDGAMTAPTAIQPGPDVSVPGAAPPSAAGAMDTAAMPVPGAGEGANPLTPPPSAVDDEPGSPAPPNVAEPGAEPEPGSESDNEAAGPGSVEQPPLVPEIPPQANDGTNEAESPPQEPPPAEMAGEEMSGEGTGPDEMAPDEMGPDETDMGSGDELPEPAPDEPPPADEGTANCAVSPPGTAPIGYGAETTGGGGSAPVVVSSFSEAEAALADYRAAFKDGTQTSLVIRYDGSFDYSTITDVCTQHTLDSQVLQIKEMENVTFEGAPGSSANFGLKINRARNVIVRNMTMGLLPGGGDSDAITIEGNGTNGDVEHVWIDHNELFSSTKDDCDGAGDTEFDGLIDIKKGARNITISYNYIHDHQKTGLIGHSDSDDMERYITFHHNYYENVVSRTPLHRFGYVHLFNNYYTQVTGSGINVRMGGVALVEANYFEHVANPVTSRYSDEAGYWDLRDNYVGEGITWTTGSDTLANAEDWQSTASFPDSELTYAYTPDPAHCVKQAVQANAGATL